MIVSTEASFQERVRPWMLACFGEMIAGDREERNHRFIEEGLELVQALGCTRHEAHQLVDYVFDRPAGEPRQEVGGVMVTLAVLCLANGLDMHVAGEAELSRIWTMVEAIRAKQAAKPKHSPLPQSPALAQAVSVTRGDRAACDFGEDTIHHWFGLSYAAYFVLPRLAMQSMSAEWQRRFVALTQEIEAAGLETPSYHLLRKGTVYTLVEKHDPDDDSSRDYVFTALREDEWANYRRGRVEELCPTFAPHASVSAEGRESA